MTAQCRGIGSANRVEPAVDFWRSQNMNGFL